jgi:hypothetical protein
MLLLLAACTENGLVVDADPKDEATDSADTGAPPVETGGEDSDTDTGEVVQTFPCSDVDFTATQWWGSPSFSTEADWTDGAGHPFYDADFELTDWSTVSMPDEGHIPAGSDRAYRGVVNLSAAGRAIYMDLQSDDGISVWVNGVAIGHWGGAWQEEGCVNDEANCTVTTTVAPVEISDALVAGDNVLAARVSNAVDNSYFMLHAYCAD